MQFQRRQTVARITMLKWCQRGNCCPPSIYQAQSPLMGRGKVMKQEITVNPGCCKGSSVLTSGRSGLIAQTPTTLTIQNELLVAPARKAVTGASAAFPFNCSGNIGCWCNPWGTGTIPNFPFNCSGKSLLLVKGWGCWHNR